MKPFEIEVQHSAETVSDLTRAQYALSHKTARLIQVVTAVVCLLIGVHAIGSVAEPFNYFFSLYGCLAIVFINVPASSLAGRVVEQIQKAENLFPVRFSSSAKGLQRPSQGRRRKGRNHRLCQVPPSAALPPRDLFLLNEQAAFIFPDGCIKGQSPAEFQAFLSSRTGKPCQTLYPWLSASLWSIIRQRKQADS
ncbi:MAG: hypothetical protein ACLR4A_08860 [Christensenellales bacterium]